MHKAATTSSAYTPANVSYITNTVHQLAIDCKKYKGIVFTDKHGNIINDENDDATHDDAGDTTWVHDDVHDDVTGEVNENHGVICEAAGIETNTDGITGVTDDVMDDTNDTHDITGVPHDIVDNTGVDEYDDISVKSEEHEDDNHRTIDNLSIIEQMNTAQIDTEPETGDDTTDGVWCTAGNHGYKFRPRPTRANSKYALAQDGQKSAEIKMAKLHAYVMMTQMSIKQDIKALGECSISNARLKELNQLHKQKAL